MSESSALEDHLRAVLPFLCGPWVKLKNGYERALADSLGMDFSASRYWDARWNTLFLEFKKGRSIWLDLVRYSEALIGLNKDALMKTETLFFLPDPKAECIEEIVCVESAALITFLGLTDEEVARNILAIKDRVPRSLNAQARVTWKDIRGIQSFGVRRGALKGSTV
jgi:hypothetical protein